MEGKGAKVSMKEMICVVSRYVAKAKCASILRSKTDAIKARLMPTTLTLLSKKKKLSQKLHHAIDRIVSKRDHKPRHGANGYNIGDDDEEKDKLALVLYQDAHYNKQGNEEVMLLSVHDNDDDENKYPDLRHTMFNEEEEEELEDLLASGKDPNANAESAIELVKNSKENFNLEDDIDEVADVFITKFHKRMRLQKLLSFKRHQQMLERR